MKIETLDVHGFEPAIIAMRNPFNSWPKSDSWRDDPDFHIGEADKALSLKLQKAGPEHCKHLRMIIVWTDIIADFTFWKQFDTYRAGIEKVSTSTMHKLMSRKLTMNDFSAIEGKYGKYWPSDLVAAVGAINMMIEKYKACDDPEQKKEIWQEAVNLLPNSYLQKRTVMMSYAAIRNIVRQREGHKLGEWKKFIDWAKELPESWMIFDE